MKKMLSAIKWNIILIAIWIAYIVGKSVGMVLSGKSTFIDALVINVDVVWAAILAFLCVLLVYRAIQNKKVK